MANEETPEKVEEQIAEAAEDSAVKEGLEKVAQAASGVAAAAQSVTTVGDPRTIEFIKEVPLAVAVEVGRSRMTIQDLLQLGQGSVIELEKLAGDPLDIFINGQKVAVGEAVIINEKFGVRLVEIIEPEQRIKQLSS